MELMLMEMEMGMVVMVWGYGEENISRKWHTRLKSKRYSCLSNTVNREIRRCRMTRIPLTRSNHPGREKEG